MDSIRNSFNRMYQNFVGGEESVKKFKGLDRSDKVRIMTLSVLADIFSVGFKGSKVFQDLLGKVTTNKGNDGATSKTAKLSNTHLYIKNEAALKQKKEHPVLYRIGAWAAKNEEILKLKENIKNTEKELKETEDPEKIEELKGDLLLYNEGLTGLRKISVLMEPEKLHNYMLRP